MAPQEAPPRRPIKRAAFSDQQRRREVALRRQAQQRADSRNRARLLASSVLSLHCPEDATREEVEMEEETVVEVAEPPMRDRDLDAVRASRMKGPEARRWFARQLMLPEWMIDAPPLIHRDWYVCARPAGKRCFVVSSNGTTVSRLRNGSILHRFPSSLPNGARTKDASGPAHSYSVLDCIFHEPDKTYYVIDMVCWGGYSLYECTAEFRFFWLNSKLAESGACNQPSLYHRYRFSPVPIYDCNQIGLHAVYSNAMAYIKDGLLFYNKHAHYQAGITPLVVLWKDQNCSQYLLDTDSKGQIPAEQQVALELLEDGKLVTSDVPPVVFGCLGKELMQQLSVKSGTLLRFAISDGGLKVYDGKLEAADLRYICKVNRQRAFADSYSKVLFQYTARHAPLQFEDLLASAVPNDSEDIEMSC